MIEKILRFLFPEPKSNLEIVLERIANQDQVRSAYIVMSLAGKVKDLDVSKDQHFMVGKEKYTCRGKQYKYFTIKFSDKDKECIVTIQNSNEPLFFFTDKKEIKIIRKAILNKYQEMFKAGKNAK